MTPPDDPLRALAADLGVTTGVSTAAWLRWWAECPQPSAFLDALQQPARSEGHVVSSRRADPIVIGESEFGPVHGAQPARSEGITLLEDAAYERDDGTRDALLSGTVVYLQPARSEGLDEPVVPNSIYFEGPDAVRNFREGWRAALRPSVPGETE